MLVGDAGLPRGLQPLVGAAPVDRRGAVHAAQQVRQIDERQGAAAAGEPRDLALLSAAKAQQPRDHAVEQGG